MNTLGLFDGMSCGQLAQLKVGLKKGKYYSCETDPYAQAVTRYNFPDTIFLGDVTKVDFSKLKDIDLVIGGSPCQDLSFAKGNGKGLEGSRSSLFYKFVEAIEVCKPEYFLLENVKMKQEWKDIISDLLGVQPVFINSADFSAQNRQRLYWTNIPIAPWTPCNTKLKDILEDGQNYNPASIVTCRIDKDGKRQDYDISVPKVQLLEVHEKDKSRCISTVSKDSLVSQLPEGRYKYIKTAAGMFYKDIKETDVADNFYYSPKMLAWIKRHGERKNKKLRIQSDNDKVQMIEASHFKGCSSQRFFGIEDTKGLRYITPLECERAQTVPDNYTSKGIRDDTRAKINFSWREVKISNTQRYKMLGNGWTIDVIAHIFKSLRKGAV